LPDEALQDALRGLDPGQITGPGGLITQLAGRVIEAALSGELSEHLGYPPGQAPPGGAPNVRNGSTPKTLAKRGEQRRLGETNSGPGDCARDRG
jgi:transposase-like protein